MYGEDVAIVAIVFGSVLSIVFMGIVGSIIKAAIKRKSQGNLTENKEFLAALREFKEKTDRRLANLEAIIAGDEPAAKAPAAKQEEKKKEQKSAIEIELDSHKEGDGSSKNSGNLRNMLNQ